MLIAQRFCLVRKLGSQIAAGIGHQSQWARLNWHADEIRLALVENGDNCGAIDRHGHLIDFRLNARWDAKAARAFFE